MEKIIINQISNPGISFTDDVNKKIISLYDFLGLNNNKNGSYQYLQQDLIDNNLFTGSYIRSFIPFLYNAGIINNYENTIFYNDFFTKSGRMYIRTLKSILILEQNGYDTSKLKTIKSDLLCISFDYMINNNYKFYTKYLDILKFIMKYKTINREEFYIMEYCLQNKFNCSNFINQYRENNDFYDIYITANNGELLSYRSNNAFNYLIAFLGDEQCSYVEKENGRNYTININRLNFITTVLNDYTDNGGIYE